MSNRILFVEDGKDLVLIVADTLRSQGYEVVSAYDGFEALAKFRSVGADIIVADVMMPKMDGFSMAREIRKLSPTVPLLFLTAKSSVDDVEIGFEIGANDYLKKPFELRELIARIKALLRRYGSDRGGDIRYVLGKYTFNVTTQTLIIDNNEIGLSHFEARILALLACNIGRTVDASALMLDVWQRDDPSNRNSLHGYIHKLRRVLRHDPAIAIVNQRGFGYMLTIKNR